MTGNKGSARRLLDIVDEIYSPELADHVEQASRELRRSFKTRDVEL